MTPRQRLLTLLRGETPDRVPVCPDISNMVPARLTGKPFWDIYVYKDPPLWLAHVNALKCFNLDGGWEVYDWGDIFGLATETWLPHIVHRYDDGRFVTQDRCEEDGRWRETIVVHTAGNPPATHVLPTKIGLPPEPESWEPIRGAKPWPSGLDLWRLIRDEIGEQGVIGMPSGAVTCLLANPEEIFAYHDDPKPFYVRRDQALERIERYMGIIAGLEIKPDFLFCGASGSLVFQSPAIFRDLALPLLKKATAMAKDLGIPTHVHSCGPETELVRIAAEETDLTIIDPLEVPPMGDCDLADLKRRYGNKIMLKGNLHTTSTMLRGSVRDVRRASLEAIRDGGVGGGFILSTGDQCGRDTPDENIRAMVQAAEDLGHYPLDLAAIDAEIRALSD